jgi:geranylgeranyl pyrophosphate synthase
MAVKNVSLIYNDLLARQRTLGAEVRSAARLACRDTEPLRRAVLRLLDIDKSDESPFRLLAFPVLGALTGDPGPALPVCVLSRLWWAGVEVLDDVMDGEFDALTAGLTTAEATIASTACITLLPQDVVSRQGLPAALEAAWTREMTRAALRSAGGQLDDVAAAEGVFSWRRVMVGYSGKSGSAYARDAVMAAGLAGAGPEQLRGWRAFGRMFGVLRQLANDRAPRTAEENTDLANGTRTLMLAHAVETLPAAQSQVLVEAFAGARHDQAAREAVWTRLRQPDLASGYDMRITVLQDRVSTLLEELAPPSDHRDLIQWMINMSADHAKLTAAGGVR